MASASLLAFSQVCEEIKATSKKLEKVSILASYLEKLERDDVVRVCRLLSGHIFPRWEGKEVFVGYSTLSSLIIEVSGSSSRRFQETYLKYGDLGATAEELFKKKVVMPIFTRRLSISDLYSTLEEMALLSGEGSAETRRRLLKGLFVDCSPLEAKYLVKILTGELRIGLVEGLLEEAISKAFKKRLEEVRSINLVTGDVGITALLALDDRLKDAEPRPLRPTNFMLADTMSSASEIAQYFKKVMYTEFKYDGIRAQLHKSGSSVKIFSRRLEDVSSSFPEVVDSAKSIPHDLILDGELVAFKDGEPLPFHVLQHRLRRKKLAHKDLEKIPISYFVFDLIFLDGKSVIKEPLSSRRRLLDGVRLQEPIKPSSYFLASTADEFQSLFERSKGSGYEGLVVKDPDSPYTPGKRGKHWVKLKKELDTLDVVVVAAEYGHGKRAGLLSDYTFAVRDGEQLKVVGKAYSGLTDEEIKEMTKIFTEATVEDQGFRRIVKPFVVLEVAFDNIQRSDRHESGYALRFPRIKRVRWDKGLDDIDDIEKVKKIYERQLKNKPL